MRKVVFFFLMMLTIGCNQKPTATIKVNTIPPAWAAEVIWYQVFVERFNNGDTANDPTVADIANRSDYFPVPSGWKITPWNGNWYHQEDWALNTRKDLKTTLQFRRYGGDLQGVINKLDYLQSLGITALYINPINDATSLHKYDARYYHHVDVNFGPDPEGDKKIIATEDPSNPATWQWTSADSLFLRLIEEAHRRNMKLILDYSWNHTGTEFWAWKDVLRNQQLSKFKDWYAIKQFDDPNTSGNEFEYAGWAQVRSMPEIRKTDITGVRKSGLPYEGNLDEGAKQHIFQVTKRWLAPNGDTSKGLDGYRLDVADQIGLQFWRDYRKFVKAIQPNALLVGEIWWQQWPDQFMNPEPYCKGDIFDAVMFYQVYKPARSFFGQIDTNITAAMFADNLRAEWQRLDTPFSYAMMNVNATHDAPRLLSCFAQGGKYKFQASPFERANYKNGPPDAETWRQVKLYLLHQYTSIGAPHIWNGDEMGMWGGDDPDCRRPLWWPEYKFEMETDIHSDQKYQPAFNQAHFNFYQSLIKLRNTKKVLRQGKLEFVPTEGRLLVYKRTGFEKDIWVLLNAGFSNAAFQLPTAGIDLLTGGVVNQSMVLPPQTGLVVEMP